MSLMYHLLEHSNVRHTVCSKHCTNLGRVDSQLWLQCRW